MLRRAPLAAALAALMLVAVLAAPSGTAGDSPDAEAASTVTAVTTTLQPGWNMAAWLGEDAPVSAIFGAVPELALVSAWDAEAQIERHAHPRSVLRDGLTRLTAGMGLWLRVGGDEAVEWTQEPAAGGVLLELREGHNRVGWTGRDGVAAAEALARFGDRLAAASRWDAETGGFERYRPGAPDEANTLRALRRGDAIEVELTSDARWWQSGTARTTFEFVGDVTERRQAEIRAETAEVLAFFAERYGIVPPEFSLVFDTGVDSQAYATPGQITIGCCLPYLGDTIAHEYTHILQFYFNKKTDIPRTDIPRWIIEGHATYVGALFAQFTGETDGSYSRAHWRGFALHVKSLRDDFELYWGPNIYAMSALAMEWLVVHSEALDMEGASDATTAPPAFGALPDHDSHIRFWLELAHSEHWHEAFEKAFGLTVDDFYDVFEAYSADRLAPLAPHLFDDHVGPLLIFVGDVPEDTRSRIKTEFNRMHRLFNERFATAVIETTIVVGNDSEALATTYLYHTGTQIEPDFCFSFGSPVVMISAALRCEYSVELYIGHYHNRLLYFLAPGDAFPPSWLSLGVDAYAEIVYRAETGKESFEAARHRLASLASRVTQPLDGMRTQADVDAAGYIGSVKGLSFLAVEQLVRRAGEPALFEYYEALGDATDWRDPFEAAFGIAPDDFYAEFEAYRAGTITRLGPHRFGDSGGPGLVFLGDVPDDIRGRIVAEIDRVHRFYTERFETIPAEFSILVGSDVQSVAEQYRLVRGSEPEEFCGALHERNVVIAAGLSCIEEVDYERPYFYSVRDLLAPLGALPEGPNPHGPYWLRIATESYTDHAYSVLAGWYTLERIRSEQIWQAGWTSAPLSSLQTDADVEAAGYWGARALGFLAAERLVALAGEPALFAYYEALPGAASWREAFEAAFGLTPAAFYADFEAYRARVAPHEGGAP